MQPITCTACYLVIIFLTSSLITIQNSVVVSHTMCMQVGHRKFADTGAPLLGIGEGVADLLETCYSPHVTVSNFVALGQTFWV